MRELMSQAEMEADRDRWLRLRRSTIGASEIAAIMGLPTAYTTPMAIWLRKVHNYTEKPTIAMERGLWDEEFVARKFKEAMPKLALHPGALCVHDDRSWQSATFDRLATENGGELVMPVQIKTAHDEHGWGQDGSDEIPPHYLAQVIWEMSTGGFTKAWVPVLFPARLGIYMVPWDDGAEADMNAMLIAAEHFRDLVRLRKPPSADGFPATRRALVRVFALGGGDVQVSKDFAGKIRRAHLAANAAKMKLEMRKNEARMALQNAERLVTRDGQVIVKRAVANVSEYTVRAHTRDTLTIKHQGDA